MTEGRPGGRSLGDDEGLAFWEVVIGAWSGFDLIPQQQFEFLFTRFEAPLCDVPERLTVYRGQNTRKPNGLSWTLDRKVAEGFARGHRSIVNPTPVVLELEVTREQVAFVCHDREESEIVLRLIPRIGGPAKEVAQRPPP